jgi:hypothetical protein
MAALIKQGSIESIKTIRVPCSHPATPAKGDTCRFGEIIGTALQDEQSDGETTLLIQAHITEISVKGIDGSGNSAVAPGDKLYYVDADTPPVSKKATGRFVGTAMEAVVSAATTTIDVLVGK